MAQKKAYIAGKISGLNPKDVFEKFGAKDVELTNDGYKVFNPFMIIHTLNKWRRQHGKMPLCDGILEDRNEIIRICLCQMLQADELHLLPDYAQSAGAMMEYDLALKTGIKIVYP